ncbi:MAG: AEC family transporter [Alkalispirochaeta sp.]
MGAQIAATVSTSVPIVLLIILGYVLRRTGILSDRGVGEVKTLIVNVALPAVLFVAFLTIEFDTRYLGLFVFMPIVLFALLGFGYLFEGAPGMRRPTPFLMTGFEFGMLGIGLFGTAYGREHLGTISVVGLPHELFIWFVFVALMRARYGGTSSLAATLRSFVTSPVIVAIVAGTILNLSGAAGWITSATGPASVIAALEMLGGIVGPLILIVIGHGTRISRKGIAEAAPLVLVRLAIVLAIGIGVVPVVTEGILGLPPIFTHAVFTFLILPPPFIVPLYLPEREREDLSFANNVLSVYTVFSVAVFILYIALRPV